MTKDKKQILVLGVLFAVILAVGAFQFMGGSKPKVDAKDDDKKKDTKVAVKEDEKDPTQQMMEQLFANPLVSRDPFVPQAVVIDEEQENPEQGGIIHRPQPMDNGQNGGGDVTPVDPGGPPDIEVVPDVHPDRDTWALRGVMQGAKTLAILEDAKGNQFLVKEGDSFNNGQTRVLSISKTQVQLMSNGQVQTLALLGGN